MKTKRPPFLPGDPPDRRLKGWYLIHLSASGPFKPNGPGSKSKPMVIMAHAAVGQRKDSKVTLDGADTVCFRTCLDYTGGDWKPQLAAIKAALRDQLLQCGVIDARVRPWR